MMDSSFAEHVAAIMAALQAPYKPAGADVLAAEVTVCIPVHNAIKTLGYTLHALEPGAQSLPLNLIIAENGSEDGVQCFIRDLRQPSVTLRYWSHRFRQIMVVEVPQNEEYPVENKSREFFNIRECFREMFAKVQTPYVLTVDADVEAPRGSVRTMLEALKQDSELALVGIQYDLETDHVKHGLSMMSTELARDLATRLEMRPPYTCMCSQFTRMVRDANRKAVNLSPLSARHLKLEA
jgi:cellulose synthase/poly-beta-1,6-N-acetylglucosamine synthase-like glycosyltransferase